MRGDVGLIMNVNLMKYIGFLMFVEFGFVVFLGKKVVGIKFCENMLFIVLCIVFIVNMVFFFLNFLFLKYV